MHKVNVSFQIASTSQYVSELIFMLSVMHGYLIKLKKKIQIESCQPMLIGRIINNLVISSTPQLSDFMIIKIYDLDGGATVIHLLALTLFINGCQFKILLY